MKIKRIFLITLLIIVLAVAIIPLVGYQMLKSRDIRSFISKQIEARTGWSMTYSNHEISLFSGIMLHDLQVSGPDGFSMTAGEVQLKPSYFKLLTGTLYLKEATIDHPHIRLVLGTGKTVPIEDQQPQKQRSVSPKQPVGLITILEGTVDLVRPDRTVQISGIELSLTPDGTFDGTLQLGAAGNRLSASGDIDRSMQLNGLRAEIEVADIASLADLLDTPLPVTQLVADVEITMEPGESGRNWDMKIETRSMKLEAGYPQGNIPFQATLNGTASVELDRINLTKGQFSIGELFFVAKGTLLPKPQLQLNGHELPVQSLVSLIPPDVSPFPPSLSLEGVAELRASVSQTDMNVDLQFDRVKASPEGVSPLAVTGELSISGPDIRIPEIRLKGDWLEATVQGGVAKFLSDHPATELALHIRQAKLPAASSEKTLQPVETGSDGKETVEAEPVPITYPDFEGVRHQIRITADRMTVMGTELADITGNLQADDRRLQLDITQLHVLEGDLTFNAMIKPDKSGVRFVASGKGNDLKPGDRIPWRLPLDGGVADFQFNINGAGDRTDRIRESLSGTIDYTLSETVLRDTPVIRQLSEILNTPLAGQRVQQIQSVLSVKDGWVDTGSPTLKTRALSIQAAGRFSLAGSLDLAPKIHLTAETAAQLPGTLRKLAGSGPVDIPFTVTGSWSNPSVKPDTSGIVKDAADQLKKKLLNRLFK